MVNQRATTLVIAFTAACFPLVRTQTEIRTSTTILPCPVNCDECRVSWFEVRCTSCKNGFYNTKLNCTKSCRPLCETCHDYDHCTQCKAGLWGQWCHLACPRGCLWHACDQESSVCVAGCKAGVEFGSHNCPCDTNCPISCPGRKHGVNCDKECAPNCVSCTQAMGTCTGCDIGFYGNNCSLECGNCHENERCAFSDGGCLKGCHEAYVAPLCVKVKPITVDHSRHTVATNDVIGACVGAGVALTIIILVIIFVVRIRRRRLSL